MPRYNLRGCGGSLAVLLILIAFIVNLYADFWGFINAIAPHCLIFLCIFVLPFFIASLTDQSKK